MEDVDLKDMEIDYTYWQSNDGWLIGCLDVWPDHLTQGKTIEELEEMLADLYEFYKEEQAGRTVEKKNGKLKVLI
jgi:predicted RNase H-like HicB family nuclease